MKLLGWGRYIDIIYMVGVGSETEPSQCYLYLNETECETKSKVFSFKDWSVSVTR